MLTRPEVRMAALSFAVLSLELALIRWIGAYIVNFGYFTNFVLMAAFLGTGLGCMLAARIPWDWSCLFPVPLLLLVTLVSQFAVQIALPSSPGAVFWGTTKIPERGLVPAPPLVLLLLVVVTALFLLLGAPIGRYFISLPRLRAYGWNVAGSLLGILAFTLCSWLRTPPPVWFAIVFLAGAPLLSGARPGPRNVGAVAAAATLLATAFMSRNDTWGPYYRQSLRQIDEQRYGLSGNGVEGIWISKTDLDGNALFYVAPYSDGLGQARKDREPYRSALVIGCGAGNDVVLAVKNGIPRIDAVDINPWVIEVGRAFHPEQPFASPSVRAHVADGREFLRNSGERYDLIVYGLPDSTFTIDRSNLRVESFLFTVEAFRSVREHLTPRGVFVLYNYYRVPWVVARIREMLQIAFEQEPYVLVYSTDGKSPLPSLPATLAAGPGLRHEDARPMGPDLVPATDDWPFLYLRTASLPGPYALNLGLVAFVSVVAIGFAARYVREPAEAGAAAGVAGAPQWPFNAALFLMGAAFTLLETRSIVTFGLFFGTTWLTNALVFAAILVSVLLAVVVNDRFHGIPPRLASVALLLALLTAVLVPPQRLFAQNAAVRALLVAAVAFLPVFCANLLFARMFRDARQGNVSFGFNLLGAMFGSIAEYLSLVWGYQALLMLAGVLYLLAMLAAAYQVRLQQPAT